MFNQGSFAQLFTHIIALAIVGAVLYLYMRGSSPPELLIGAFGVVMGQYFRRQTEDDTHTSTERVLGTQVLVQGNGTPVVST